MASYFCFSRLPVIFTCHGRSSPEAEKNRKLLKDYGRRTATAAALVTAFLAREAFSSSPKIAASLDLRFTVPDQTPKEADAAIKGHARGLLQIKPLLDAESWREAQQALRESSSYLKQDLYTIIQAKPGSQRPQLRKLYTKLFNNVSMLDYAARSKDTNAVQECYSTIVATLQEIFTRL